MAQLSFSSASHPFFSLLGRRNSKHLVKSTHAVQTLVNRGTVLARVVFSLGTSAFQRVVSCQLFTRRCFSCGQVTFLVKVHVSYSTKALSENEHAQKLWFKAVGVFRHLKFEPRCGFRNSANIAFYFTVLPKPSIEWTIVTYSSSSSSPATFACLIT